MRKHPGMPAIPNSSATVYSWRLKEVLWSHDSCPGATGKFLFHAARRPLPLAATIRGCFPFCRSEVRLHVLVSVVFGPLVETGQSGPRANRVDSETNPGRERMYRLALGVITVGLRLELSWKHENRRGVMMTWQTDPQNIFRLLTCTEDLTVPRFLGQ